MRRQPKPAHQPHPIHLSEFADSLAQASMLLRGHGIVDPKMIGTRVKGGTVEIAVRHCVALDGIETATLSGFHVEQGGQPKSHWMMNVNRRCVVVWHRSEIAEGMAGLAEESA